MVVTTNLIIIKQPSMEFGCRQGGHLLCRIRYRAYHMVKLLRQRLDWYAVFIAVASLIICFSLRPHYALALLWLFITTCSLKNLKDNARIFLISLLLVGVISTYLLAWDELSFRAYSGI